MFTAHFKRTKDDPFVILDPDNSYVVLESLTEKQLSVLRKKSSLRFVLEKPLPIAPILTIPTGSHVVCTCDSLIIIDELIARHKKSIKSKPKNAKS